MAITIVTDPKTRQPKLAWCCRTTFTTGRCRSSAASTTGPRAGTGWYAEPTAPAASPFRWRPGSDCSSVTWVRAVGGSTTRTPNGSTPTVAWSASSTRRSTAVRRLPGHLRHRRQPGDPVRLRQHHRPGHPNGRVRPGRATGLSRRQAGPRSCRAGRPPPGGRPARTVRSRHEHPATGGMLADRHGRRTRPRERGAARRGGVPAAAGRAAAPVPGADQQLDLHPARPGRPAGPRGPAGARSRRSGPRRWRPLRSWPTSCRTARPTSSARPA